MSLDVKCRELSAADLAVVRACPPLAEVASEVRERMIAEATVVTFPRGAAIVQQGELGEAFYVLLSGTADVLRVEPDAREIHVAHLPPGAYFGEQALLGAAL